MLTHTLTAYAAPVVSQNATHPVLSAIDARHDHVYFQVVNGDGGFGSGPYGSRLAVSGNSVGGNMAAAVTLMAHDRGGANIVFQQLMWPALDTESCRSWALR